MASGVPSSTVKQVRRLASKGWSAVSIARWLRLEQRQVREILSPPPRPTPRRRPARPEPDPRRADWGYRDRPDDAGPPDAVAWVVPIAASPPEPPPLPPAAKSPAQPRPEPTLPATSPEDWEIGRPWGASDPRKLSESQEREVHELRAAGMSQRDVATRFGVSPATIGRITKGRRYGQGFRVMTLEEAAEAAALQASGATYEDLGRRFGVDRMTAWRTVRRLRASAVASRPAAAGPAVPAPEPPAVAAAADTEKTAWGYRDIVGDDGPLGLKPWPRVEPPAVAPPPTSADVPAAPREPWEGPIYI